MPRIARKRQHEEAAQAEKRAGQRAKESLVSMQYMDAILGYAIATGIAVSEGKVNGEMSAAKEAAANVKKEYDAFIKKTAAEHITK